MNAQTLDCVIEIPKGSRNKYELDAESGKIKLDRFLFASVAYPTDYGYVPETLAEDGDPLDAMVCVSEPTFPGCLIESKAIALFRMNDDDGVDAKLLCVPCRDPNWSHMNHLDDLSTQLRDEIAHFFGMYKTLEEKHVDIDGWYPAEDAATVLAESQRRWRERS